MTRTVRESFPEAILRKRDGKNQYHLAPRSWEFLPASAIAEKVPGGIRPATTCSKTCLGIESGREPVLKD